MRFQCSNFVVHKKGMLSLSNLKALQATCSISSCTRFFPTFHQGSSTLYQTCLGTINWWSGVRLTNLSGHILMRFNPFSIYIYMHINLPYFTVNYPRNFTEVFTFSRKVVSFLKFHDLCGKPVYPNAKFVNLGKKPVFCMCFCLEFVLKQNYGDIFLQ